MKKAAEKLELGDAIRIRTAEMWLEVGEPTEALVELQKLTRRAWRHPWAEKVLESANQAMIGFAE